MPKVSVIIPTYNRSHLIADCIESVLNQTYKDFEVIVVDDGSKDNTEEVLRQYEGRIRYIRQENAGAASARNRGISESKGDYVAFLDSDDFWAENKLELQSAYLRNHPVYVLVCGNGNYLDGKGKRQSVIKEDRGKRYEADGISLKDAFHRYPIRTSTILIRKDAAEEVGGFNTNYRVAEDMDFGYKILLRYGKVGFVNSPLYKVSKGDERLSANEIRRQSESISILQDLFLNNSAIASIISRKEVNDRLAYRYYHLGQAYAGQGDKMNAVNAFKKALSYRTFYPSCLFLYLLFSLKK